MLIEIGPFGCTCRDVDLSCDRGQRKRKGSDLDSTMHGGSGSSNSLSEMVGGVLRQPSSKHYVGAELTDSSEHGLKLSQSASDFALLMSSR
jgi:hypothetical protein